jgi:hypothetical protein
MKTNRLFIITSLVALFSLFLASRSFGQYTFTDIDDPLGTEGTEALGVSGNDIVGFYTANGDIRSGFLYNGSTYSTLDDPLGTNTTASGVSGGNVVGYYSNAIGTYGFLYNGTTYTTLNDPLATEGTYVSGISGNDIVGYYMTSNGEHAFLFNGTTYTTLVDPADPSADTFAFDFCWLFLWILVQRHELLSHRCADGWWTNWNSSQRNFWKRYCWLIHG